METLQRTANRGSLSTGYEIDNSTKFEADNTERMYRAWGGGGGNDQTWTVSLWVKRTELGTLQHIWGAGVSGNDVLLVSFQTDNTLKFRSTKSGADDCVYVTNRVFRDTSAWYHIVVAVDTTSGTAGDRLRIYINGVEETSFSTETDFSQNDNTLHNANSSYMEIATAIGEADRFCGYIAEVISISGSQLAPTTFGEFDGDSGIWIPKAYTGSFPQNSVYLEFKDSSSLGTDTSGNGQTFTLQNISSADQSTDTPTNNFCTWNPLWNYASYPKITEGATKVRIDDSTDEGAKSTIGLTNGKWYWEAKPVGTIGSQYIGIQTDGDSNIYSNANSLLNNYTMAINPTGRYYSYSGSLSESADQGWDLTASDWLGIALDMDSSTQTIKYYKNGSLMQSLDLISDMQGQTVFPFLVNYENRSFDINFGGYTINTISSAASDANGYGTFEYAPPDSHFSICTKNLAEYG